MPRQVKRLRVMRLPQLSRHLPSWSSVHLYPTAKKYSDYAETILKNLSGTKYLAAKGSNQGYVLMHSTGSLPHGSEIDVPLNYADYYYMEALKDTSI